MFEASQSYILCLKGKRLLFILFVNIWKSVFNLLIQVYFLIWATVKIRASLSSGTERYSSDGTAIGHRLTTWRCKCAQNAVESRYDNCVKETCKWPSRDKKRENRMKTTQMLCKESTGRITVPPWENEEEDVTPASGHVRGCASLRC